MPGSGAPVDRPVSIPSPLDVTAAYDALAAAVRERRTSNAARDSENFYRLGGSTPDRTDLYVIGQPRVIPGVPAGSGSRNLRFRGRLDGVEGGGCVLVGVIDVEPGPLWIQQLFGFIERHNARMTMTLALDFERFLRSIVVPKQPPIPIADVRLQRPDD